MLWKSKNLFLLFLPIFLSCTTVDLQRKVVPPLKSYVKVYHSITILKCTEKYKKKLSRRKICFNGKWNACQYN